MADAAWWFSSLAAAGGLLVCAVFALLSARRVGFHTPYGSQLSLFGLGYWIVLVAFALSAVRPALDLAPSGSIGAWTVDLVGWLLHVVALSFLLARFDRRVSTRTSLLLAGLPIGAATIFLLVAPITEARVYAMGVARMGVDGLILALLLASVSRLVRVAGRTLGALYVALIGAMAAKTAGDLAMHYGAATLGLAFYGAGGLIAAAAWMIHFRAVLRWDPPRDRRRDPHLRPEQRLLRELAQELRGLVGANGAALVLHAASGSFSERGIAHKRDGDVIEADASAEAWREAIARSIAAAGDALGAGVRGRLQDVARAYGDDARRAGGAGA